MNRNIKLTIIALLVLLTLGSWGFKGNSEAEKKELLASTTKKTWQLVATTPESELYSCQPLGSVLYDNSWIFHQDGAFEFDHGSVTEDPDCMDAGCCTDLINLVGTWQLIENGTKIVLIATHKKGDRSFEINQELLKANIDLLNETTFKFSQVDESTGEKKSFEFRVK